MMRYIIRELWFMQKKKIIVKIKKKCNDFRNFEKSVQNKRLIIIDSKIMVGIRTIGKTYIKTIARTPGIQQN